MPLALPVGSRQSGPFRRPAIGAIGGNIGKEQRAIGLPDRPFGESKAGGQLFRIARFDQGLEFHRDSTIRMGTWTWFVHSLKVVFTFVNLVTSSAKNERLN